MDENSSQVIRQCTNPACTFRFPTLRLIRAGEHCPRCGWETHLVEMKRDQFSEVEPQSGPPTPQVSALLDNIRSTFNVGAMFRTADGAGFSALYLCGTTATPPNPKLAKTALGAESNIAWTYHLNAPALGKELIAAGLTLWALELHPRAVSLFEAVRRQVPSPLVLVVGNEISGVDPELLELCTQVVSIPMLGTKGSLNVSIAFGIAAYTLRFKNMKETQSDS
jgi:23S rRNA (guanosine2251-2'-O)-methyltransferase